MIQGVGGGGGDMDYDYWMPVSTGRRQGKGNEESLFANLSSKGSLEGNILDEGL